MITHTTAVPATFAIVATGFFAAALSSQMCQDLPIVAEAVDFVSPQLRSDLDCFSAISKIMKSANIDGWEQHILFNPVYYESEAKKIADSLEIGAAGEISFTSVFEEIYHAADVYLETDDKDMLKISIKFIPHHIPSAVEVISKNSYLH